MSLFLRWQRETRIRTVAGRLQGEVAYFAPCGKKLRQYPDVMKVNLQYVALFYGNAHCISIALYNCLQVVNGDMCGD